MAHEIETFVYYDHSDVGEKGRWEPWHGLGTPISHLMTSEEALNASGLNWDVEARPIYTDNGIQIPGYIANTRNTDNSVLGVVTNKYTIVQNRDAFNFTDNLIGKGAIYETAGSLRNGKRVFMLAQLPKQKILGDEFGNFICFTNTHDGTGAVRVLMTPTRVVCNNTLNLALNNSKRMWSCKHMGKMEDKLHEAEETLFRADKYMTELGVVAERLANISLNNDQVREIVEEMFPMTDDDTERAKANMTKAKNEFMVAYYMPDIEKFRGTAWGLLNAAADWIDHSSPQRNTATYNERNFERIVYGHPILDQLLQRVGAQAL